MPSAVVSCVVITAGRFQDALAAVIEASSLHVAEQYALSICGFT